MNHRLDQYLWNIEDCLRALPDADRKTETGEIRQHLTVLIAAGVADGQTEDAATRAAIHQFGTAREIGSRLRRVERRKRFGMLSDVVLFCAIAGDVIDFVMWGVGALWINGAPLPADLKDATAFAGPPYWGLVALILLFIRHGTRRSTWQNLLRASPIRTAVGFFFCVNIVMNSWNLVATYAARLNPTTGLSGWDTVHLVVHHFGLCWLAAYGVGRWNRYRASVADAVGTAAALVPVAGFLAVTIEYMPSLTEIVQNPVGCLMAVGLWAVPGTLFVLFVRFGVHVGEKSRRAFAPVSYEGNSYEPAI